METNSSMLAGPASQLVPFELEEVSQHFHQSVPLQKPDSLGQEPFLLWVPTGQWDVDQTVWAAEPMRRIRESHQGWGADSGWVQQVDSGDEGEHLTSLFVTLEALCTTQPKGNYLQASLPYFLQGMFHPKIQQSCQQNRGSSVKRTRKRHDARGAGQATKQILGYSWKMKSKRILIMGALALVIRHGTSTKKPSPLNSSTEALFRLKLCLLLNTYLSLFLKRLGE